MSTSSSAVDLESILKRIETMEKNMSKRFDKVEKDIKEQKEQLSSLKNDTKEQLSSLKNDNKEQLSSIRQDITKQNQKIDFLDDRDRDRRYSASSQYSQAPHSNYTHTGHGFSSSRRKADHPFDR